MMISRPLRVASGSGHLQFRQNEVEKLRAVERSKRGHLVLTGNQRNACGKTYAFAEHALPVALRHREQRQFINFNEWQIDLKFYKSAKIHRAQTYRTCRGPVSKFSARGRHGGGPSYERIVLLNHFPAPKVAILLTAYFASASAQKERPQLRGKAEAVRGVCPIGTIWTRAYNPVALKLFLQKSRLFWNGEWPQ